jgi:RHS repeat-associated protein
MILEQIDGSDYAYFYHHDQIGSVRAIANSSGTVQNTYDYDAYGKVLTTTGTLQNPFGYTGEYTDGESGLVYLRARYYDPATQQFLTVDPMLASTEQAYAYVGGSPTNFRDPWGLDANCGLFPNFFDEQSCVRQGLKHPAGPWVAGVGVVAMGGVVFLCFATGPCTVAAGGAAVAGAGGAGAAGAGTLARTAQRTQPTSSWVVRAGEPTVRNLTNGYSGGGLSVQWNPGSSVDYLAKVGQFPNAQICFADYPTLVQRSAQLGYNVQILQTPGSGLYHHELVVKGVTSLPEPLARLWSQILIPTLQENPLQYIPGGR